MTRRIPKTSTLIAVALLALAGPLAGDAAAGTLCVQWNVTQNPLPQNFNPATSTYGFTIMKRPMRTLQSMPPVPNGERVCVSNPEMHGQNWYIRTRAYQNGKTITLGDSPFQDMGGPGENREVHLTITGPGQFWKQ